MLVDRSRSSVLPLLVDWERAILTERPRLGIFQVMMPIHDWNLARWELERLALPKFSNELGQGKSRRESQNKTPPELHPGSKVGGGVQLNSAALNQKEPIPENSVYAQ